ncbi:TPA: glycosyltransferase family 4 protein, partial [Enterococcus faecium]
SKASMMAAKQTGLEFYIAGNWKYKSDEERKADEVKYGIKIYQVDFYRNPLNLKNIKAYHQIVEIIKNEKIDIIHCNTPIGGVVGRIAGLKCKVKKVIYQAHGFHFYSGAPKINWFIYYPMERWLAHYTDVLITINHEDYTLAQKLRLRKGGKAYYIPGVGIDTNRFMSSTSIRNFRESICKELNIPDTAKIILSVGELNENKNHLSVIHALQKIPLHTDIYYIIAGVGEMRETLQNIANELGLHQRVFLLGYRSDIPKLLAAANIYILPSLREGLNASLMEAMASGLPCIVGNIRGNVDLIEDGKGGFLINPKDEEEIAGAINRLADNKLLCESMGAHNLDKIKDFDLSVVINQINNVYHEIVSK